MDHLAEVPQRLEEAANSAVDLEAVGLEAALLPDRQSLPCLPVLLLCWRMANYQRALPLAAAVAARCSTQEVWGAAQAVERRCRSEADLELE